MSNHTPGPWMADLEDVEIEHGDDIPICSTDPSGEQVGGAYIATVTTCWPCADDSEGDQAKEGLANAKLIAAAPDLFAALLNILEIGKRDLSNSKYDGYFETARAAIRKARGDS